MRSPKVYSQLTKRILRAELTTCLTCGARLRRYATRFELGIDWSVDHPGSVELPRQGFLVDKPVEGGGHRRAVRAHHLPKHPVCEPKRKMDAVGLDSTPAIGQVPQQEQEPVLYALRLEDRQAKRQPARPSYRSLQQDRRDGRHPGTPSSLS